MNQDNRVCILGMGYVGLTLAVVMAEAGFEVDGIEIKPEILDVIRGGRAHFFEANLDYMLRRNLGKGRLRFAERIPPDREFDVYVVTVGTPLDAQGRPRMDMVRSVSQEIAAHMRDGALVVLRSTVRLGTTLQVTRPLLEATGKRFALAFCPERTIEGRALAELPVLPQIVGGVDETSRDRAGALFQRITPTILKVSSIRTAELIKLLDNSFRDMFFAFGNEVALLCEKLGLDAAEVIKSANLGYERTNIAWPGFVGGPCLEKDPHILIDSLADVRHVPSLVQAARRLNEDLVGHAFRRAVDALGRRDKLVVSILGMAFKGQPDTDDLRGSPSLLMLEHIRRELPDATVRVQDYVVQDEPLRRLGVQPVDDEEAFRGADIVFVMNNNRRYTSLDFESRVKTMRRPAVLYDAWNVVYRRIDLPPGVTLHALGT
jgi:nucleotide sugar dehydrogenase